MLITPMVCVSCKHTKYKKYMNVCNTKKLIIDRPCFLKSTEYPDYIFFIYLCIWLKNEIILYKIKFIWLYRNLVPPIRVNLNRIGYFTYHV